MKQINGSLTVFQPSSCLSWLLRAGLSLLAARGGATPVGLWWLLLGHVVFRSCIPESGICWILEHRFSDCEMWAELLLGTMVIFSDQSLKPRPLAWQAGFLNRWLPREALHFVFYTPLFLVAPKEEAMSSSLRCPPPDPFLRHLLLLFPFTLE